MLRTSQKTNWVVFRYSYTFWALGLSLILLPASRPVFAQTPEPQNPPPISLADAARNAREHKGSSPTLGKIFTNDDFAARTSVSAAPTANAPSGAQPGSGSTAPADCDNAEATTLKLDLQSAQEESDQLQRQLNAQPAVISGGNLDSQNFKPGGSGLTVGSLPLLESQPQASGRIAQADLNDKIASLKDKLGLACASSEDAELQKKLDEVQQQLGLSQRQFALDQEAFLSNPNSVQDSTGKSRLDAEQELINSLQSEQQQLKDQLAARHPNQAGAGPSSGSQPLAPAQQ